MKSQQGRKENRVDALHAIMQLTYLIALHNNNSFNDSQVSTEVQRNKGVHPQHS